MSEVSRAADRMGVARVAAAACLWGTWALFVRKAAVSPWVSAPLVFLLMGLMTLPLVRGERAVAQWSRSTVVLLVLHAALAAGNIATYFAAMSRTTLAVAVLTHYLAPVIVAVSAPFIDRTVSPGARTASVVALAGLVLILEPWSGQSGRGDVVTGALLGMASALCYAGNVFLAHRLEPRIGARRIIAYHALLAGLLLLPGALAAGFHVSTTSFGWLTAGALVPGAFAGLLFVIGLARIGSARAAILAYLEPLVAVLLGWLMWAEAPRAPALAGMVLIVGAGAWVSSAGALTRYMQYRSGTPRHPAPTPTAGP